MDELETIQPQTVENTSAGAVAVTNDANEKPKESAAEYAAAIKNDGAPEESPEVKGTEEEFLQAVHERQAECPMIKTKRANERVCEVCGHVNRGNALICEMCSNYLID